MTAPLDKLEVLKRVFGHESFREGQEQLVDELLGGHDVLGVMPTGAGKSVCYQLPALMLEGITLVISPLISLMKDQVMALKASGVAAAYINSSLTPGQQAEAIRRAAAGAYRIIYVAPERLDMPSFLAFAQKARIPLLAVDEAHCVSQWGQDFRPSYLRIADFVRRLPRRPAVGAFTATATRRVRDDIVKMLDLEEPLCRTTGYNRPNLHFASVKPTNKFTMLCSFLDTMPGECGIVYCNTRRTVEDVAGKLAVNGYSATRYHAGLSDAERHANQDDFQYDRARIMVATNAFGMGIDKSNVSYVVHYNMPGSVEAYYQEAGRAGRDGSPAECLLLWCDGDIATGRFFIEQESTHEGLTVEEAEVVRASRRRMLESMVGYCYTTGCLRAYILRYFGEGGHDEALPSQGGATEVAPYGGGATQLFQLPSQPSSRPASSHGWKDGNRCRTGRDGPASPEPHRTRRHRRPPRPRRARRPSSGPHGGSGSCRSPSPSPAWPVARDAPASRPWRSSPQAPACAPGRPRAPS